MGHFSPWALTLGDVESLKPMGSFTFHFGISETVQKRVQMLPVEARWQPPHQTMSHPMVDARLRAVRGSTGWQWVDGAAWAVIVAPLGFDIPKRGEGTVGTVHAGADPSRKSTGRPTNTSGEAIKRLSP